MLHARRVPSHALLGALMLFTALACSRGSDKSTSQEPGPSGTTNPVVEIKTSKGTIGIELYPEKAPKTVENFLAYASDGFYDGTIFHRVIADFMIQGGGYTGKLERKATHQPIPNEANNGLKNEVGTIAMARTSDPHSATSQFFINVKDNRFLDFKAETPQGWGYAVFGKVVDGLEVVRSIEQAPTSDRGGAFRNLPDEQVLVESVRLKKAQ